jgi:hypothetical protein
MTGAIQANPRDRHFDPRCGSRSFSREQCQYRSERD